MTDAQPRLSRRDQAIGHAADLLRELGPTGLTSVAVAKRMGITQPAVYRHVRNMGELKSLAARQVVAGLTTSLHDIVFDQSIDWDQIDHVDRLCRDLITVAHQNQESFNVVTRWRFGDGPLGIGIRSVIAESCDLIVALMESRWRIEFGYEGPLGDEEQLAQRHHAEALYDDTLALMQVAFSTDPGLIDLDAIAKVFQHRFIAGWVSYVIDMNERTDLPYPMIDLELGIVPE